MEVKKLREAKKSKSKNSAPKRMPALTPEAREKQIIAKAYDRVEKMIDEGTASSQILTHFLKLGSSMNELEKQKLEYETYLIKSKTESLNSAKSVEKLYKEAIQAFGIYSGQSIGNNEGDEEDE